VNNSSRSQCTTNRHLTTCATHWITDTNALMATMRLQPLAGHRDI